MLVFARHGLATAVLSDAVPTESEPSTEERSVLLLEGDWPADGPTARESGRFLALDSLIDATDYAHLDADAERVAVEIADAAACDDQPSSPRPNFAEINALRLRYEVLRWLRIIAFCRQCLEHRPDEGVDLYVAPGRDKEYAALWQSLARSLGWTLRIHFVLGDGAAASAVQLPQNASWRRLLARLFANRAPQADRSSPAASNHRPRVMFVGNPRILDPVCDETLDRGANVAWLYDRFAVGAWAARRRQNIAWLTCDDVAEADDFPAKLLGNTVVYDGIDLTATAEAWYRRWRRVFGPTQSRQWSRVGEHLRSLRPNSIVLDEDATPLARIVIAHAARLGIPTLVVQHGVCCVRFGFAPLAADLFCAWDDAARKQLETWGVPTDRVAVTGRAHGTSIGRRMPSSVGPRRIILFATLPPRDDRPDAVTFHLTTRSYATMLDTVCAAVAELAGADSESIELVAKMHPRAPHDPLLAQTLRRYPKLRHRIVVGEPLEVVLAAADCVLSCVSSAGIEAAAAGIPVVQLLPQGSGAILPAEWYGLLGSARTLGELRPLLQRALRVAAIRTDVEATTPDGSAAAAIVDRLFAPQRRSRVEPAHTGSNAPHFMARALRSRAEEAARG